MTTTGHQHHARTVQFAAGERNVFMHILTACNLSCKHCYINPDQHGTKMLSRERLASWIKLFAPETGTANIVFLGGEPTMHPDLIYGLEVARASGFRTTVDTNGYLFHDFLARCSPDLLDNLSFSLDGPDAQVNDHIRGAGSFGVCTEHIGRAIAAGFRVSVIYTVSSLNIDHLHRLPPLLDRLGVRLLFLQVIGLRGKSAELSKSSTTLQVDYRHWRDAVLPVAQAAANLGIAVIYPKVYLDKEEPFVCAARVAQNYFVFPNGRVYQCPLCEDYPLHSYEIRDDTLIHLDGLQEERIFALDIAEGCTMNKLLQPDTIACAPDGTPLTRVSCCMLKQRVDPVS
jgi:MoaA/NifB/PqqE/SkfB family radical SAM enzyme